MPYFAAALVHRDGSWSGHEVDLDDVADLEEVADLLRDLSGDGAGPAVLLLEADEEYVGLVRVDGGAGSLSEPRVFLSDRRAVLTSDKARLLWEDDDEPEVDLDVDDEEESSRPVVEPAGDPDLLADLGLPADALLQLCAEEGLLPGDVLSAVCERAGCLDALEALREA